MNLFPLFEGGYSILLHQTKKKRFFRPLEAINGPITKPFELGVLQMILSEPPMSNSLGVTHMVHTSRPKFSFLKKIGKKLSYFLKQKIVVMQAKSFCNQKSSKKNRIFEYWTANVPNFILEVTKITKVDSLSRANWYRSLIFWEKSVF